MKGSKISPLCAVEEAWLESEKVDEGLEATRTASGGCLDLSVSHTGLASCAENIKPFCLGNIYMHTNTVQHNLCTGACVKFGSPLIGR